MPVFPRTESEIAALALQMIQGLADGAELFPAPPVASAALQVLLDTYNTANRAAVVAANETKVHHAVKDEALGNLIEAMRADLKYAESVSRTQPERLGGLGWGPRKEAVTLELPGEVREIAVSGEGDTWVVLRWKPPVNGGAVGMYQVQRSPDANLWEDVALVPGTETLLSNQPRGVQHIYRVVGVNKSGRGQPSGIVKVVL